MSLSSEEDFLASPAQINANKKRRVQNQRACDRCRLKKSRSRFLDIPIDCFLIHLHRRSPLSVCPSPLLSIGCSPCHFAGDGTPSRPKCTHCTSSNSDCIFTEPTKVRFFTYPRAVLWLSACLHRPEVLRNGTQSNLS